MDLRQAQLKIVLADDHQVVRQGLRTFLELYDDVRVVGEAEDGARCVEVVRREKPDVVLMDLVMPVMDGIEAIRKLRELDLGARVIVLTSFAEDDKVFPAIRAGASSYLLKDVSPDDLIQAIRAVHRGETRLHPEIARRLMEEVAQGRVSRGPAALDLSERELEVLRLVAEGRSNRDIAGLLVISEKTVKTHVSNILSKLHMADRTQLAVYAIKTGLASGGEKDPPPSSPTSV
jgi:NarL family two-component system response regulator LiaR